MRLPEHRFSEETRRLAKERANGKCEYCGEESNTLEAHHRIACWFAKEYPAFAPALISSLANLQMLCPNCHREFHNPKTETRESYAEIAVVVLQEYLKGIIDPHQDDWRDDLVKAYNGNYYKGDHERRTKRK